MKIQTKYLWILLQLIAFSMTECRIIIPDVNQILASIRTTTSTSIQNISQTGARKTVLFPPLVRKESKLIIETPKQKSSSMVPSDEAPLVIMISILLLFAPYIGPIVDKFYKTLANGYKYLHTNLNLSSILESHPNVSHFMKETWKELQMILKLWGVSIVHVVQFCSNYWIALLTSLKGGVCTFHNCALSQVQSMASSAQRTVRATAGACQNILVGGCKSICAAYSNCKIVFVKNRKACSSIMSETFQHLYGHVLNTGLMLTVMTAKAIEVSFSVVSTFVLALGDGSVKAFEFTGNMIADGSSFAYTKLATFVAFLSSITVKSATWSTIAVGKVIDGAVTFVVLSVERLFNVLQSIVENAPEWFDNFVESVPFLEFGDDEQVVFTKSAQQTMYLMSIIVAANPSVLMIPQKDSVKKS